jgi:hypothetical protein
MTTIGSAGITFLNGTSQNSHAIISVTAGNGLTGGTITHPSGTIALDFYTGSDASNSSFPIGSYVAVSTGTTIIQRNASSTIYVGGTSGMYELTGTTALAGTWRCRGRSGSREEDGGKSPDTIYYFSLYQRTA